MQLSSLPGKLVLTPKGERLGYIKEVYVCKNFVELSALCCVDEEEEEFFLPAGSMHFVGDAVIASDRKKKPSGVPCPVGRAVFGAHGEFLGHCSGFETEKRLLTVGLSSEKRKYRAEECRIGEVVLVPSVKEKSRHSVQKKPKRTIKNVTDGEISEPLKEKNVAAIRAQGDEYGVLGKQVKKSVPDVAETGETVTPATLKRARENNKLLELAANTLTE